MRRVVRWVLVLGLLGGIGSATVVWGARYWREKTAPRYLTATVSRGRVEFVVNSTGTVKAVRTVSVGAFVSGPIAEIKVDFNSEVKEGDLLAVIDPRLPRAAVARDRATLKTQQAELNRVRAQLKQAENNYKRAMQLRQINRDYLSDTERDQFLYTLESAEAQVTLAEAAIEQAEANLRNSQANLDYTEIRCPPLSDRPDGPPVTGVIIERKVDPGQTVAASFQTPELFVVAPDLDRTVHIFASVDEADIGHIYAAQKQDRPVSFTVDAYQSDLFEGKIYQIRMNATTTQNVVTYPVVIRSPNPGRKLMPGMTANLSFLIEEKRDVLRVPAAALRYVPPLTRAHPLDRHYLEGITAGPADSGTRLSAGQKVDLARGRSQRIVWVQDGEWLRAVRVTLGLMNNEFAELLAGDLVEDQAVVIGAEMPGGRP